MPSGQSFDNYLERRHLTCTPVTAILYAYCYPVSAYGYPVRLRLPCICLRLPCTPTVTLYAYGYPVSAYGYSVRLRLPCTPMVTLYAYGYPVRLRLPCTPTVTLYAYGCPTSVSISGSPAHLSRAPGLNALFPRLTQPSRRDDDVRASLSSGSTRRGLARPVVCFTTPHRLFPPKHLFSSVARCHVSCYLQGRVQKRRVTTRRGCKTGGFLVNRLL